MTESIFLKTELFNVCHVRIQLDFRFRSHENESIHRSKVIKDVLSSWALIRSVFVLLLADKCSLFPVSDCST